MNRYFGRIFKLIYSCIFHALSAELCLKSYIEHNFDKYLPYEAALTVLCHSLSWSSPSVLGVSGKVFIVGEMQNGLWGGAQPAIQAGGALMKTYLRKALFSEGQKNTNWTKVPPFPVYDTQKKHTSTINPSTSQEYLGINLENCSVPNPNDWLDAQLNPAHSPWKLEEFPI